MKKQTILRVILILLTLGALSFMAYRSYNSAIGSISGGSPSGYIRAVTPIIVNPNIYSLDEFEDFDMSVVGADDRNILAVSLYNTEGNLEFSATKNMPRFAAKSKIPALNIKEGIVDIAKKESDMEWLGTVYLIKKAYDELNGVVFELENAPPSGLNEEDVRASLYYIEGVILVVDLIDALEGFTDTYKKEIEIFKTNISPRSDPNALSESAKNGAIVTKVLAEQLAEHITVSYPLDDLPAYFDKDISTDSSGLKIFKKHTGGEVIAPIFVFDEDTDSELRLAHYVSVVFQDKSYNVLKQIPQKELYVLAGLTLLLLCFIFVPSKKRGVKIDENQE